MVRHSSSAPDYGFFTRAAALYGRHFFSWAEWTHSVAERAGDIRHRARHARLRRFGASHRGIGERRGLKHLIASNVDQPFLEEICTIEGLERLDLQWPVTSRDLSPLRKLKRLKRIHIDSPHKVEDFTPLLDISTLRFLFIENAPHLRDAKWLSGAHHLEAIGIEGSLWTTQHLESLAPFAGLQSLRGLFLGSVRLGHAKLGPLAECPQLEILHCARFASIEEFKELQRLKPHLSCTWFDPSTWA
jgi:hypothetical protein